MSLHVQMLYLYIILSLKRCLGIVHVRVHILYIACEDDPMQMDLNLRSNFYPFSLGSALCMNKMYIPIESIFRLHKKNPYKENSIFT